MIGPMRQEKVLLESMLQTKATMMRKILKMLLIISTNPFRITKIMTNNMMICKNSYL